MNAVRVRPHVFAPDHLAVDYRGEVVGCVLCPLHKDHAVHAEVASDDSDRIVGEGAETVAAQRENGTEQAYHRDGRAGASTPVDPGLDPDMHDRSPA